MKVPRGCQVVKCRSIEFVGKDVIDIISEEDFLFLLGANPVVYKLNECYYHISDAVAFVYQEGKDFD